MLDAMVTNTDLRVTACVRGVPRFPLQAVMKVLEVAFHGRLMKLSHGLELEEVNVLD